MRSKPINPRTVFADLERSVTEGSDISAVYMAVGRLNDLIPAHPECVTSHTVSILSDLIEDTSFEVNKLAYFLYRSIGETLAAILVRQPFDSQGMGAGSVLTRVAQGGGGVRQKAASEALGSLPVTVSGPMLHTAVPDNLPAVTYRGLLEQKQIHIRQAPTRVGRSLVAPLDTTDRIFVVKLAETRAGLELINKEAAWMAHLRTGTTGFPVRFHIPQPITVNGGPVFSISNLPGQGRGKGGHSAPPLFAMGYIAHREYFIYPNDHRVKHRLPRENFSEIILRNARLLGELTARGIVHTAPIPLFHNRIQRGRRDDEGRYEWYRGGRLDRWLYSCRYPNFGKSGPRDFEHLSAFKGTTKKLYQHIGDHLLSLLLVAGSYFRNAAPEKIGYDSASKPLDMRNLFDREYLEKIIRGIFEQYYKGFAGESFSGRMSLPFAGLADRMVEEMGVDRHMEERLRAEDQRRMSAEEFTRFLKRCGFSDQRIGETTRGRRDIHVHTGPHLGGFNRQISLPEMTAFLASASACCIAGRYWRQRQVAGNRQEPLILTDKTDGYR